MNNERHPYHLGKGLGSSIVLVIPQSLMEKDEFKFIIRSIFIYLIFIKILHPLFYNE